MIMTKSEQQKASQEIENFLSAIYNCLCKLVLFIFKSLFLGIGVLWKKRSLTVLILLLIVITISIFLNFTCNKIYISIAPGLIIILIPGVKKNISSLLNGSSIKIFRQINFKDKNGNFPKIIKILNKSKGRKVIYCKSFIPYKTWLDNKDLLETGFNSKLKIIQETKQVVKLIKLRGGN